MKRSEVLKYLEEIFQDVDISAENVLCNLEVVYGMNPPRNHKHPSDDDRSPVYAWEEE